MEWGRRAWSTAADVQPELVSQGIVALLDQVFPSGQPFVGRDMLIRHDRSRDGRLEDYYYDLVYQPLLNPARRGRGDPRSIDRRHRPTTGPASVRSDAVRHERCGHGRGARRHPGAD